MAFNKYQTSIEDLHLEDYPQEVVEEFYDALNSVQYIKNLVSEKRPLMSELPRDDNGRAIIDLANPPIFEDVDYFRQTALTFKKLGKFTELRPNANPNSEYGKWMKQEVDRCWYGMVRPEDGAWVNGDMYFYLNYVPIVQTLIIEGTQMADRIVDFPEFWEGVWWRSIYIEAARKNGRHAAEIAKRGASKSYFVAAILAKLFTIGENKNTSKRVRGMVMAYQKEYLVKDGTLNKFEEMKDFLAENTQWPYKTLTSSLDKMQWVMGYKDLETNAKKGTGNEIIGISAKDDPDKGRGKRSSKIIIEEFGNFPKITDTYRVMLPSVQEGDIAFGQMILIGTGGSEGADFAGAMEIIYNPLGYNIQPVQNVYDKAQQGKSQCIFFFSACVNRKGCYNHDGISDITKALLEICHNRYIVKYNTSDPMALTRTKAENPITLQEAIMKRDGSMFPVAQLVDRIDQLKQNHSEYDDVYVGELTLKSDGSVGFKPTNDQPIRFFPHNNNKLKGAIEIFEMPQKDQDDKVFNNRYILSCDPYDDDTSQTLSLGSVFVLDLWNDMIVAEYTGRPQFADEFYEVARRLCIFYNGKMNYENNKKGIFAYFKQMNSLYLLTQTFEFIKDRDDTRSQLIGNKAWGTPATEGINYYGRTLLRDWLLKPVTEIRKEGNEEVEVTVPNLMRIRNLALLIELSQWNQDGNFDRVSSMGMMMLYRQDRMIVMGGDLTGRKQQQARKDYIGNDEYFIRNYDQRFDVSIQIKETN